jgi:hypothetical protein
MANIKKITHLWNVTGLTVYCIIRRDADGYLLNDADGAFASGPADPYVSLAEDATIKGMYELSESRSVWDNGKYSVVVYRQTSASPAPASDIVIGAGTMEIKSDAEVVNANVQSQDNIDFGASQKASLNAATPASIQSYGTLVSDIATAVWGAATRTLTAISDSTGITTLLTRIASALTITGGKVDVNDKTGFALTSAYDSSKTAAQAGAKMDLVDVPNATAITALQSGMATSANQTAINNNILAVPAAVWAVTTRTLSSFGSIVSDIAAAVWAYATRTISGVSSSISYPVLSGSVKQDYIAAINNLVPGSDLPLGETEAIFAINQAIKTYSTTKPRVVVEDEDGNGTIDYAIALLADWSDGFSVIKAIEYPVDDDEAAVNVLQDDAWQIYQKPTGKQLRFLENTPSTSDDIRISYTSLHVCTDDACTIPAIDEGAVQMLAAATFCDMLATYYAQTSDSVIQADSVDHKSKASEYASRARTYRQQYLNHLGIKEGSVAPASVTRDQDAKTSHGMDGMTHKKRFR